MLNAFKEHLICRMMLNRPFIQKKGVALLMVIWILMLLTVIVTEFCFTMRTRVNITRNLKESTQAHYIAVAGLNEAIAAIVKDKRTPGRMGQTEIKTRKDAPAWRINYDMPAVAFGEGNYTVRIQNESGRVDINRAGPKLLDAVLEGFDLDEAQRDIIVDSIMDWRDTNDLHRTNGAEDSYYQSLDPPYTCKDGDFDAVDELRLVRGITPELFYGGLNEIFTVLPVHKESLNKRAAYNFNRVNINSAPKQFWAHLPGMTPDLVEAISNYRQENDFKSKVDLKNILGPHVYNKIAPFITLEQIDYYHIFSVGRIDGSATQEGVEAVIAVNVDAEEKYQIMSWREKNPMDKRFLF